MYTPSIIFAIIRTLTINKIKNAIKILSSLVVSMLVRKPVVWGKPYTIFIEPSGFCNLSCPECVVGNHSLSRNSGNMTLDAYKRIIDEIKEETILLYLYFQGEPFMNKHTPEMIRYATEKGIFVITSTNGMFFDSEQTAAQLVDSGLGQLIISVDGATQDVYSQYRVGGDLKKVIRGIRNIKKSQRVKKKKFPEVFIQFLVMKQNEHQIPQIKKMASELGVSGVLLKSVQIYNHDDMETVLPQNVKYRRYKQENGRWVLKGSYRNFCSKLWVGSVISWNSHMFACCFDKNGTYFNGDLNKDSFHKLWTSPLLLQFRETVLKKRSSVPICNNCSEGQKIFF